MYNQSNGSSNVWPNTRMQQTAFGARDRACFGVIFCGAPRRRLMRNPLGGCYQTKMPAEPCQASGAANYVLAPIWMNCLICPTWCGMHQEKSVIRGINHLTLAVADIERSFTFYRNVLGLQPLAKWPRGAYLLAGDMWIALVVDPGVRTQALPEYTHIAFSVAADQFAILSAAICAANVPIWQDNWTEGDSLYFADPDGHKLEIHASDLATRLRTAKAQPWEGLEFFV